MIRLSLTNTQYSICILMMIFTFLSSAAESQQNYQVGFSKVSIDPPDTIFGLALGGYGVPAEGRFTTTWHSIDVPVKLKAIASVNNQLHAIGTNNKNYTFLLNKNVQSWKEITTTSSDLSAFAYVGKKKYILDQDNQLWLADTKKIKIKAPDLVAISTNGNFLYGIDAKGGFWRGNLQRSSIKWTATGRHEGVTAMAIHKNELVFSDNQGRLWKALPGKDSMIDKVQIGRINGFTYVINVQSLAVANNRLYALDGEGKLYVAGHQSEKNLEAGAVAIRHKDKDLIIITVDVCGLNYTFTQAIKRIIAQQHHLSPEAILINISHTHFAPVSQAWTTWAPFYQKPDSNYLYNIVGKGIIDAVNSAIRDLEPATIQFARGETRIGGNRSAGRVNKEPVDRTLDVIKVLSDGKMKGSIFLTGCHPVFRNKGEQAFTISGNYPAVARKLIAEQTDCSNHLFIQGCGGDINPLSDNHRETGIELARDVLQILNGSMSNVQGQFTAFMDSVLIPITPMTPEQVMRFRQENEALKSNVGIDKNIRWADLMLQRYHTKNLRKTFPVYFQTLNVGSWKLVGLSREAVTSYGQEIRKLWPDQWVSVAGYCNDVSSYLPDAWHINHKVYEGYDSFFWYGQEGIPSTDIQERIIQAIKSRNK